MSELSRRQFLSYTASTAVAAALPVSPAWLRGVAEETATSGVRSLADGWEYFEGSLDGPWEVWNSSEIAVWQAVTLPHCFNHYDACDPDTPAYRGPGWYRTHLEIANPYAQGRTLLHFGGAGQTTDVFLGDEHMAQHVGGYDEFVVDVTDVAQKQMEAATAAPHVRANKSGAPTKLQGLRLAIRCDNGRDLERMPSDLSDFTLYGGLYRPLSLVYLPAMSIEAVHVHVTPGKGGSAAEVVVNGRLYGALQDTQEMKIAIEVLNPQGKRVADAKTTWAAARAAEAGFDAERTLAKFALEQPSLWSPKQPNLYQCRVTLSGAEGQHVVVERFGVRTVDFAEGGPFYLNGERLLLRGTHRHEDHANYAAAMPAELIRQEMRLIKAVGANFIRLAHYQQQRVVLDMCDELGILVWEEVPWCRSGVAGERWQQMGRDKLHNMVDQHFNHPAVIFWGLGNEDDWPGEYQEPPFPALDKDAIRGYMQELNALAHKLDSSRYTSYRRCDFARDIPDVYSPSIWAGWYSGLYTEYEKSLETQRMRVKRFIHIEWGADSHARRHSEDPDRVVDEVPPGHGTAETGFAYLNTGGAPRVSRDGDWSETYACNLFDWCLKVQETLPWLSGAAQWIFKDFTTPLRVENPVPRVNQKGMIERDMNPKEAYYVFQSYWSDVPMVRLYGHTWPVRWGRPDEKKMVKVYSNCPEAELFLNDVSVGTKHRDSQDFPCAGLRWLVNFKPGENHLRVVAKPQKGKPISDEIALSYQTEQWSKPSRFSLKEKSRDAGTVTVLAQLLDESGVVCLDARNEVRFTLAGAAQLIDNQGTSNGSRVVQLYNGRAEISLTKPIAKATIGVESDGVAGAFCTIVG